METNDNDNKPTTIANIVEHLAAALFFSEPKRKHLLPFSPLSDERKKALIYKVMVALFECLKELPQVKDALNKIEAEESIRERTTKEHKELLDKTLEKLWSGELVEKTLPDGTKVMREFKDGVDVTQLSNIKTLADVMREINTKSPEAMSNIKEIKL